MIQNCITTGYWNIFQCEYYNQYIILYKVSQWELSMYKHSSQNYLHDIRAWNVHHLTDQFSAIHRTIEFVNIYNPLLLLWNSEHFILSPIKWYCQNYCCNFYRHNVTCCMCNFADISFSEYVNMYIVRNWRTFVNT